MKISKEYLNNPKSFIKECRIKSKAGKIRNIITYTDDSNGALLRKEHQRILDKILSDNDSCFSKCSIAYKKNQSAKDSLSFHQHSNVFYKLDISSFFESITLDNFQKRDLCTKYNIDEDDIKLCFYKGYIPLGLVASPILSEVYLNEFDKYIEKFIKNTKLHYSRYCDDILISSEDTNFKELDNLKDEIINKLLEYSLNLNTKKIKRFDISTNNNVSVRFVGLNYVKKPEGYIITISKGFILTTLDIAEKAKKAKNKYKKEYLESIVRSRVAYIKYNSDYSYKRFLKKYKNRFNNEYEY